MSIFNEINKQKYVFLMLNLADLTKFCQTIIFINFLFLDSMLFNKFNINALNKEKMFDLRTSLYIQS